MLPSVLCWKTEMAAKTKTKKNKKQSCGERKRELNHFEMKGWAPETVANGPMTRWKLEFKQSAGNESW